MKYSEIVKLNNQFIDTYDLTHEATDYWKTFVPTERFITILKAVVDSIDASNSKDRRSFWVIGSYGSGKSHASSVIKHLISDEQTHIEDYVNSRFSHQAQLSARLLDFRKRKRVFPVVIKGSSGITDARDFAFVIQKSVTRALELAGITMTRETEFSKAIQYIKSNKLQIDWTRVIESNIELGNHVSNEKELIKKLENYDSNILKLWESVSDFKLTYEDNIEYWLSETQKMLSSQYGYSSLLIMWDEFTSLLGMTESGSFLSILQNIAELSKDLSNEVFLYIISHRRPEQTPLSPSDIKHLQERINDFDYSMEPITTYQIMSTAIEKKDILKWETIRSKFTTDINSLVEKILSGSSYDVKQSLSNLFPIHPYSAYLSTFFARTIGSRERSIFNFLHDQKRGFVSFINKSPDSESNYFLTVDFIFDYFLPELEKMDDVNSLSVLGNYNTHKDEVLKKGPLCLKVYKGLLLLNLFIKTIKIADGTSSSLLRPNEENVLLMFMGSDVQPKVLESLQFIDEEHVIVKNPSGLYEVGSSRIPFNEVQEKYEELSNQVSSFISIATQSQLMEISKSLTSNILRENADSLSPECLIVPATIKKHDLIPKLNKSRKKLFKIMHVVFIGLQSSDLVGVSGLLQSIDFQTELDKHPYVFITVDTPFGTEDLKKVIHYKAYELVAESQNLGFEETSGYRKQQALIIDNWIKQLVFSFVTINTILPNGGQSFQQRLAFNKYGEFVNDTLSPQFYNMSPEVLNSKFNKITTATMWKKQTARKAAQAMLLSDNKKEFEGQLKAAYTYLYMFYYTKSAEDVLNIDFSISPNFSDHIIAKTRREFDKIMSENSGALINIGKKLKFLSEAPYGYYPCIVFYGMLAWLFKPYIGKVFLKDSAKVVNAQDMSDLIVSYFEYASEDSQIDSKKLTIRLGSPYEDKLIKILCDIFDPSQKDSLKQIVWGIALDYVKNKFKYPLWVAKYHSMAIDNPSVIEAINALIDLFKAVKDEEYSSELIQSVFTKLSSSLTDMRIIFNDTRNNSSLFKKWFESKNGHAPISDEDLNSIEEFIVKNSGEELVYTCEDETATHNRVLTFLLNRVNPGSKTQNGVNLENENENDQDQFDNNVGNTDTDHESDNHLDSDQTSLILSKIESVQDILTIRAILKKIVTLRPELSSVFISIIKEEGIDV